MGCLDAESLGAARAVVPARRQRNVVSCILVEAKTIVEMIFKDGMITN